MEYTVFLIVLVALVAIFFADGVFRNKRNREKLVVVLKEKFGQDSTRTFNTGELEIISDYYNNQIKDDKVLNNCIDDITWNDFSMDDVFAKIDRCQSRVGEEQLYALLHFPKLKEDKESEHIKLLRDYFSDSEEERVRVQVLLHELNLNKNVSLTKILSYLTELNPESNVKHFVAGGIMLISIILIFLYPAIGVISCIAAMVYSIFSYLSDKKEVEPFITTFNYIFRMVETVNKLEKENVPVLKEDIDFLKEEKKCFKNFERNMVWISTGVSGMDNPMMLFVEYIKMIFHIDLIKFNSMLRIVKNSTDNIENIRRTIGIIDASIAIADFKAGLEVSCEPVFTDDSQAVLHIEDCAHLLVHTRKVVTNSICTKGPVLITGSNASGKSTFLKAVGIAALLAETIGVVPATSYEGSRFRIYSSMALNDSIRNGESYFIVEIKSIKRILDAAAGDDKILCFIDEVLRGTNTVERIAASTNILKSLSKDNIIAFAATHDIELTELLKDYYRNYHFEEEISEHDVKFNFMLKEGKAMSRNAIKLLNVMNYDKDIVTNSEKMVDDFARTGVWSI